MAAVLDQKQDPAARFDTKVDEQIAEATSRIRFHDLAFGGLLLAAMVLAYIAGMVVLDKYLVLLEWVRQVSLAGFVAALGGVAWLTLIRPLRRDINPLYAAVQVERTIEDAKNSVAGYVEAKDKENVHPTVRAAMGARAAKAAAGADLNQAVDHRSLLWTGGVVVALVLALIVLFFLFRPSQFLSLAGRALVPFSSDPIATRTQLTLVKPDPADLTITTGQSVSVSVHVGGKVPAEGGADRVRVLLRHNPADPNYEVVPMEKGESSRDWQVKIPDYLIQNGFWYKVAAGDAETPEYRVTVRTAPLFTDFEVNYEFPAYVRMKQATAIRDNRLVAIRGTKVTLIAKTNREVRDGRMDVEPTGEKVAGKPAPGRPDSLRFEYKLVESGSYRLHFTATNGERNTDPPPFSIQVISDNAPAIVITKPEEDEIQIPANGQLAVDAAVGDDYGIDKVTLRMKLVGEKETPLADKPYQDGKSFLRSEDNTWPTGIEYKDSVDLTKLKDAAGLPADLKEGMVIEYWVEAADNCTEPKPNVGKSKPKRVRLTAPKMDEMDKTKQEEQKTARKNEEQKHNQAQNEKHATEERKPPQNPNQQTSENPQGENTPPKKDEVGKPPEKTGNDGNPMPKGMDPMGKPPEGGTEPKNTDPMKGDNPPKKDGNPQGGMGQQDNMNQGGMTEAAPPPREPGSRNLDETADKVQEKINEQNKQEGTGKGSGSANENERTDPAQPKPPEGGKPEDGKAKPEPQPNPMGGSGGASTSKPEGNLNKPPEPAEPKPGEKKNPMGGNAGQPSETKREPLGGSPGTEKPQPKEQPQDPQPNKDPMSGAGGKPAGEKKEPTEQPQDPAGGAGAPKPMPEPNRGADKDPPAAGAQPQPPEKQEGGAGKPKQSPQAGAGKPAPKEENANKPDAQPKPGPQPGTNDPMMPPTPGSPSEPKPEGSQANAGMPQPKGPDKGEDKEEANAKAQPQPKNGAGGKQPDKEAIDKAVKDLTSNDPARQKAGRDALDKQVGPEARKEAEQLAKDLKSEDKATREAAEKKLKDIKDRFDKETAKKGGENQTAKKEGTPESKGGAGGKPKPEDIEKAVGDLNSPDKKTRDAAREKLEKELGKDGREKAEKIADDMKSGDKGKQADAQKQLDDLKNQAGQQANKADGSKQPGDKKMTKEEADALAKKLDDLGSKDDAKRRAAEKEIDDKIGQENREKLQQAMKDLKSGDPQKQEEAKKQLQAMRNMVPTGNQTPQGPAGPEKEDKRTILEDSRKRLESAQLQLENFEKNRHNKDLHEKLGMNQGDYDRFVEGYLKRVEQMEKEVAAAEAMPETVPPVGPPVTNVGGGNKVDQRGGGGAAGVGGTGFAPPGYSDAARRFQESVNKLNNQKK